MELMAGAVITPRLRLTRAVGRGGMGSVWVAYHETLKTEVAVKFLDSSTKDNPKALARFEREAEIAAKLKNPHVAQMYDHGVLVDGTPFIVMELLEGESLQERLQGGPLSLHETSLVMGQVAQALGKAHKLGIVHRDVKPGNLFLIDTDYELFVKLLDFGIAKHSSGQSDIELTKTGNLMGSPLYMSPEQFTKVKSVDYRADLWSLAVVAYRCLTTVPPFQGEAIGNIIMAVMQQDYRPITDLRPSLPAALNGWFARAFHPMIGERFQSARELATSFVTIVRNAADDGAPRAPLPSITEMTHAALSEHGVADVAAAARSQPALGNPDIEATAELPRPWRLPSAATEHPTAELPARTDQHGAEAATFAPATTTLNEGGARKRVGILVAAAAALLVGGIGVYGALGNGSATTPPEESAVPVAAAPVPESAPVQPESAAVQPESAAVQPESAAVQPRSAAVQPKSAAVQPEPGEAARATVAASSQPSTQAPNPAGHASGATVTGPPRANPAIARDYPVASPPPPPRRIPKPANTGAAPKGPGPGF